MLSRRFVKGFNLSRIRQLAASFATKAIDQHAVNGHLKIWNTGGVQNTIFISDEEAEAGKLKFKPVNPGGICIGDPFGHFDVTTHLVTEWSLMTSSGKKKDWRTVTVYLGKHQYGVNLAADQMVQAASAEYPVIYLSGKIDPSSQEFVRLGWDRGLAGQMADGLADLMAEARGRGFADQMAEARDRDLADQMAEARDRGRADQMAEEMAEARDRGLADQMDRVLPGLMMNPEADSTDDEDSGN